MSEITVRQARETILGTVAPLESEEASLPQACHRVLTQDLTAPRSIPPWDNSAMDGFAVQAADVKTASEESPVSLAILEDIPAGKIASKPVEPGSAIRIMTGAPVPKGADAVVPVEWTRPAGENTIEVHRPPSVAANIRRAGEDVEQGATVLKAGTVLTPAAIGMAASLGHEKVPVYKRPEVAILSTGDEIAEVGTEAGPGQIYTSNSYTLMGLCQELGVPTRYLGIAADTRESLHQHLEGALSCDVIITTDGVSVGDYDYVKEVLAELGSDMKFWKIAQRPGPPLAFGVIGGKPAFGLPGNPVSTMVSFYQYIRPSLLKMQGHTKLYPPVVEATLEEDIPTKGARLYFLRGILRQDSKGGYSVRSTGAQGSGILTSMVRANGLILIPAEQKGARKGDRVQVQILDPKLGWSTHPGF